MITWSVVLVLVLSLLARVELESLETLCGMFDGMRMERGEERVEQKKGEKYGSFSGWLTVLNCAQ